MGVSASEVSVSIVIAAPPERVWQVVSDIAVMPRLSSELQSVEWVDGFTEPALGARFQGVNRHPAIGEWTTRSQIVVFDPPRRFGWAVGDPDLPAARWTFALSPAPTGTALEYTASIGPGPSGVTMLIERQPRAADRIIQSRLEQFSAAMRATLDGIRELVEVTPGGGSRQNLVSER